MVEYHIPLIVECCTQLLVSVFTGSYVHSLYTCHIVDTIMVEYRVINTSDEAQAFFISLCQSLREQRIKEGFKWITVCIEGDVAKDGINLVTLRASGFPVLVFNVSRCPGVMHNVSEFLHNPTVLKVMYDCRMDAVALFRRFGIRLQEVFDLQIALSRNTDNVSVGSAFSKFPINLSNAHKSEEDISKQMLNAAMNVENLFNVFKSMCVCSNLELARNLIVPLTDDSINRELEGVAEGTLPTIDSSNYAKLDVRKQIHLTALAFYNDILLHDVDCREQCQDRTVCKLMYADWKRRTHVPGNPIHTRYKGGFSQVFTKLVFMGKTVQRAAEELEHNVIAWSIDSAGSGSTCARSARQVANTTVRQRRAQCERDRNGIEVGPYVIPDAVSTGQLVSSTITIKNISEKPQALLAVGFLQSTATGSNGVFQSKLSCLQLPLQLPPGAKAEVEIVCNPACGMNRDILELNFHTFSIARFLEIQAGSAELLDALKPTAPYQRRRRQRKQRDTATLTVGNPPRGGGRRWQRDCAEHKLPHAFRAKERLKTMTVELDAVHQNLVVDPMGSPAALQGEYAQFYHKLLFVEELQLHSDLHEFDMEDVVLRKSGALFTLAVPGLAENRPSVLRGDKLIVRLAGTNDSHHGFAHRIERDQVYVRFHDKFPYIAGIPVDVEFTLNRTLLRIQHNQLDLVHHLGTAVLYPGRDNISLKAPRAIPDDLKEFRRGLNPEQWAAVRNILAGSARPSPYIVFGPPGTGKTRTMVEAITQMVHIFSREVRILACAPSNTAADVLCGGLGKNITPSQMVRVVAESRTKKNILEAVHKFCPPVDDESHFSLPADKEALGAKQVVVTTLSMASKLPFLYDLDPGFFDVIVIDEAGQAMEPEATAVIASLLNPTNGQVVLAGDPRQLGPIIHSSIAKTRGLEVSLLERLTQRQVYQKGGDGKYNPHLLTKLVRNYRKWVTVRDSRIRDELC